MKVNRGIFILTREIERLADFERRHDKRMTVGEYRPERVETQIGWCCKRHPRCGYKKWCVKLWDIWSENAPIEYAPAEFERALRDMVSGGWLPQFSTSTMYSNILGMSLHERFPYWLYQIEIPNWRELHREYKRKMAEERVAVNRQRKEE